MARARTCSPPGQSRRWTRPARPDRRRQQRRGPFLPRPNEGLSSILHQRQHGAKSGRAYCIQSMNARLAIGLLLAPALASAQVVRGTLRDSIFQQPLGGAVVLALDADGKALIRDITNGEGQFA